MSNTLTTTIQAANTSLLNPVRLLYASVKKHLRSEGIRQWDFWYPNRWIIRRDLKRGRLYVMTREQACLGAVVLDEEQSGQYQALRWRDEAGRPAVIHRLAIHPDYQGQGLGKQLLRFAERLAVEQGYTSIRLDAYTGNSAVIGMYERAGYDAVGQIRYPFRALPYQCFEKKL